MSTTITVETEVIAMAIAVTGGPVVAVSVPAPPQINVATLGLQGPKGETGTDFVTAGEALGGGRLITVAGLHSMAATISLILGISTGAVAAGAQATVRISGVMTDATWTWTPGGAIFASDSGIMTQTAPASGAMRRVAIAVSATTIFIDLQPIIILE